MARIETGGTQGPVPLTILSDGAESRAYLVPLAANRDPAELSPAEYEITWTIARTATAPQQATLTVDSISKPQWL